jgi:adenylate cyclase
VLPDRPSIAVLSFTNMSNDSEQAYFSDGMADDIITELSRDHALFVIARNSSFTYKEESVDVKQVGRELGVRYVLEGSVRRHGGQIRVNAQLIHAETGEHIWAERYDRAVEDVFAVQDEITTAVTRAILPAIGHAERQRATRKSPEGLSAWEAWHRALGYVSTGDQTPMRHFLLRAAELDPHFAPVHAMLAFLHIAQSTRGVGPPLRESAKLAEAEARIAIEQDPRSAVAHAMLAWACIHQGDWATALEETDAAIALNRNDPWGHLIKGYGLMYSGRRAEALEPLASALRLDPRGPTAMIVLHQRALCDYFEGDYTSAEALARRAIREYPGGPRPRVVLAASLGQQGRVEEARAALEEAMAASPGYFRHIIGRTPYHSEGDHERLLGGLRKAGWDGSARPGEPD